MQEGLGECSSNNVPLFFNRYKGELRHWGETIKEYVDANKGQNFCILAISRKGPRFLELMERYGFLDKTVLEHVRVEFAIGLEPMQRVLLVDDSLIHGSTFLRVYEAIKSVDPTTEITGTVFALGRSSFSKAKDLIQFHGISIRMEEMDRYFFQLTQALYSQSKSLLTALPVIEVNLHDEVTVEQITSFVKTFAASSGTDHYHFKRNVAFASGSSQYSSDEFHSWHVPVQGIVDTEIAVDANNKNCPYNNFASIIFYFDIDKQKKKNVLRIIPCTHISFSLKRNAGNNKTYWENTIVNRFAAPLKEVCECAVPCREKFGSLENLFSNTKLPNNENGMFYSKVPPFLLQHIATIHN